MEKEIQKIEPQEIMTTRRARAIAQELMGIVKELGWAKKFGGEKEHLEIEAWQFIAAKEGATASITDDREIRDKDGNFLGFEASAAVMRNGECLTEAKHECTIDEKNWAGRPRYALRGMAQTRAMSRACRNRYAWIARMGGFAGTPADEMSEEFNSKPTGKNPGKPKNVSSEPTSQTKSSPETPEPEEKPIDAAGPAPSLLDEMRTELSETAWKNSGQLDKWWNDHTRAMLKLSAEERVELQDRYRQELKKLK